MASIRPISDLRNHANDISDYCHDEQKPVFITRKGKGDMVVMSNEEYERQQVLLEVYAKLGEAEAEIANGAKPEDFGAFAKRLRGSIHGKV